MENITMRTGFGMDTGDDAIDASFMKKVQATLQVLLEKAVDTATIYVKAAGRDCITQWDIRYALIYECHEFWDRPDLEQRIGELCTEMCDDEYEGGEDSGEGGDEYEGGDDSSEGGDDSSEGGEDSSEGGEDSGGDNIEEEDYEVFTRATCSDNPTVIQIHRYVEQWGDWFPEDRLQSALKAAIDQMTLK